VARDTRSHSVWFSGPREVEVRTEVLSGPGAGEVLVEAVASLISAGTELVVYRGDCTSPEEYGLDRPGRAGRFPFPVRFGYQVVGRVVEAGRDAAFAPGQLVFARHPHQSLFTLPATAPPVWAYPVPAGVGVEEAAFANLFGVALNALLDVPVRVGDRVVVSGLGVIGLLLARLCRLTAATLILVEPRAWRREVATRIGADAVVPPAEAGAAIDALTEGRGADVYFEASGAPPALQAAIAGTGQDGTVVVVSNYGGRRVELALAPEFHYRRLRVVSTLAGVVNPALSPRWDRARRAAVAMEWLARDGVGWLVSHRLPLREAATAYRLLDSGAEGVLGVLLTYDRPDTRPEGTDHA